MSQSSNTPHLSELNQQAIDWLIRLRSDDISDDELFQFADWLAQDHAHSEAFAAAENLYDQMTQAVTLPKIIAPNNYDSDKQQELSSAQHIKQNKQHRTLKFHKRWLVTSLALAATWLFASTLLFPQQLHFFDRMTSDYYTQTGETQEIQLSDGSHLLLNTNSAISVDYDKSIRKIILNHGQVRFSVSEDSIRPFVVVIDELNVRALGTVFQIYKSDTNNIRITVQEHAVAVSMNTNTAADNIKQSNNVTVQTGQQIHIQSHNVLPKPRIIELNQETAWQQQRIIINDQPLGDLISELERYHNGRIFLSDSKLKNLRITGVFSLNNPDAVLNTVCKVLGLKETQFGPWWTLIHR